VLLVWWLGAGKLESVSDNSASSRGINSQDITADRAVFAAPDGTATASDNTKVALPQALTRDHLEAAKRDPFTYLAAAVPPALRNPPLLRTVVPPNFTAPIIIAAPAPSAPQHNLVFTGRMTGPDGKQLIFATLFEIPVTLAVGQSLANGYRVDGVTEKAVQLTYVALGTSARLELPEPPKYETR
jgi:hypothetical protein